MAKKESYERDRIIIDNSSNSKELIDKINYEWSQYNSVLAKNGRKIISRPEYICRLLELAFNEKLAQKIFEVENGNSKNID